MKTQNFSNLSPVQNVGQNTQNLKQM